MLEIVASIWITSALVLFILLSHTYGADCFSNLRNKIIGGPFEVTNNDNSFSIPSYVFVFKPISTNRGETNSSWLHNILVFCNTDMMTRNDYCDTVTVGQKLSIQQTATCSFLLLSFILLNIHLHWKGICWGCFPGIY